MLKNDILSLSKTIYNYFVENKIYPKSVKIKGENYTIQEATYIMSRFITNIQDEVLKVKVKGASNPNGDRCNRKVSKSTYTDMCKRLNQYIKQNGELPNYVTIDGKQRCSIILFMLQLSKIITSYAEHNKFPSHVLINSDDLKKSETGCSNPYKALPYNTNTGCNAMGQNTPYYCAPSMLQKMLYRLGIKISQYELARVMGTTTDGTSHQGIETAIAYVSMRFNVSFDVEWFNFDDIGWEKMGKLLCRENTSVGHHLLYRNEDGHYEYPLTINTADKTIKVINSLGDKCGSCYCGYIEKRSFNTHREYISGISQKSILVLTKK